VIIEYQKYEPGAAFEDSAGVYIIRKLLYISVTSQVLAVVTQLLPVGFDPCSLEKFVEGDEILVSLERDIYLVFLIFEEGGCLLNHRNR